MGTRAKGLGGIPSCVALFPSGINLGDAGRTGQAFVPPAGKPMKELYAAIATAISKSLLTLFQLRVVAAWASFFSRKVLDSLDFP